MTLQRYYLKRQQICESCATHCDKCENGLAQKAILRNTLTYFTGIFVVTSQPQPNSIQPNSIQLQPRLGLHGTWFETPPPTTTNF